MNDQLNPKERELKELLENASFELDTNAIWDSIEHRIPHNEKDKNRFVFWFFGITALFSIVAGFYYFVNTERPFNQKMESSRGQTQNVPNEIHARDLQLNEEIKRIDVSDNLSPEVYVDNQQASLAEKTTGQNLERSKIASQTPSQNRLTSESIFKTHSSSNIDFQKPLANEQESKVVRNIPALVLKEESFKDTEKRFLQTTSLITKGNTELVFDRDQISILYSLAPLSSIQPVNEKAWLGFVSFGFGTNKNVSSYSKINSSGEFNEALLGKESGQWGLGGELMYNFENKNGWSFGLGVDYNLNVSRYLDQGENFSQTSSIGNTVIDISADGTINTLTGELTKTSVNNADVQWYRQHHNVDAHFRIAKNIWSSNRWFVNVEGGLLYNIYNQSSGYYFEDTANGLVKFNSNEENPYKNTQGFKTQIGLNIGYAFEKIDIGLRSYYRYNPNSILEKNHFYELKNSQLGFQISVAYRPNWE